MAVHATEVKMTMDMRMPPDERKDMEERSLSHRLGSATSTPIKVSS
jgi:hypothetical protein